MTIKEAKDQKVFILNYDYSNHTSLDFEIEIIQNNYYDLVMSYQDETTTPKGVGARVFVEEIDNKYVISSWGVGGNNYKCGDYYFANVFETEKEALEELFKRVEKYDFYEANDFPTYFEDQEEAQEELIKLYCEFWACTDLTVKSILDKRKRLQNRKIELETIKEKKLEKNRELRLQNIKANGGIEAVLVDFFKKETHPAPQEIYDYKLTSGLSWNKMRKIYK